MARRVTRVLGALVTTVVVLGALGLVALVVVVPRLTGGAALTVLSGSMSPTIPVGSLVLVVPTDVRALEPGTVITYQKAPGVAEFETHRIVAVHPETTPLTFTTKGDDNPKEDVAPVPEGAVRGEVRAHVPYVGFVSDVVRTPRGMLLVGGVLALLYLGPLVVRLARAGDDGPAPALSPPEDAPATRPAVRERPPAAAS